MNETLFRAVNTTARSPFLDVLMPAASDKTLILIPSFALFIALQYYGSRRLRTALWAALLAFALADAGSAQILKALFALERPYGVLDGVHLHRGDEWRLSDAADFADNDPRFGFPSSHASNAAALAAVLACLARRTLWVTIPWALLVGYSRVYTGNHWPADVFAGYIYGAACGWAAWTIASRNVLRRLGTLDTPPRVAPPPEQTFFAGGLCLWFVVQFAALRLSQLPLNGDEAYLWDLSRRLAAAYAGLPPLVPAVIEIFVAMGGNEPWAIRSVALFASCGILALTYALALRLTASHRAALLAGGLAMCLPLHWSGAFVLSPRPVMAFFALLAVHLASRGRTNAAGFTLGAAMLASYGGWLVLAPFIACRRWRTVLIAVALNSGVIAWNLRHPALAGWEGGLADLAALVMTAAPILLMWKLAPLRWTRPRRIAAAVCAGLCLIASMLVRSAIVSGTATWESALAEGPTIGAAVTAIRDEIDGAVFVHADTRNAAALAAFYTKGRPRAAWIGEESGPKNQYALWNEAGEWEGPGEVYIDLRNDGRGVTPPAAVSMGHIAIGPPEAPYRIYDIALVTRPPE